MAELRISNLANGFVLYFETPESRINAYALASTLVSLADAAKAAGRTLNGAVDIEIVVEALNSGSFRARVSAIARESGLFVKQQLVAGIVIVCWVITSMTTPCQNEIPFKFRGTRTK
jgi:hypothetical protein